MLASSLFRTRRGSCDRAAVMPAHLRTFAPVMMAGAALLLAAVAAPAQDAHGAIAFGQVAQGGAVAYGLAWDYPARDDAQEAAMNACLSGGGSDCTVLAWFQNGCGALAIDQYGMAQGKGARSLDRAEARALQACEAADGVGCAVVVSQCVSPDGQPDTWAGSESVLAPPEPEEEPGPAAAGTPAADRERPAADAPPRDEGGEEQPAAQENDGAGRAKKRGSLLRGGGTEVHGTGKQLGPLLGGNTQSARVFRLDLAHCPSSRRRLDGWVFRRHSPWYGRPVLCPRRIERGSFPDEHRVPHARQAERPLGEPLR